MALTKVSQPMSSTPSIDDNGTATALTIDSSGFVAIGSTPSAWRTSFTDYALDVGTHSALYDQFGGNTFLANNLYRNNSGALTYKTTNTAAYLEFGGGGMSFYNAPSGTADTTATFTNRMSIDSSGNIALGGGTINTAASYRTVDINTGTPGSLLRLNAASGVYHRFINNGADLSISADDGNTGASTNIYFNVDGNTAMQIDSSGIVTISSGFIGEGDTTLLFASSVDAIVPRGTGGAARDNAISFGNATNRWKDIYAANGTIQTSDEREKQDIEELSQAEQNVAVSAKALLRKFRWKDAVADKGDDARIHFGIIAQDLKAAFEAEGLDAGRYAMFINSEWWETYTDVPAVEAQDAVLDEDGNVVTEAVEAKEAYTRTDIYNTEEESPEGAVRKDRMGVRYSELLAFIIAVI